MQVREFCLRTATLPSVFLCSGPHLQLKDAAYCSTFVCTQNFYGTMASTLLNYFLRHTCSEHLSCSTGSQTVVSFSVSADHFKHILHHTYSPHMAEQKPIFSWVRNYTCCKRLHVETNQAHGLSDATLKDTYLKGEHDNDCQQQESPLNYRLVLDTTLIQTYRTVFRSISAYVLHIGIMRSSRF